MGIDSRKLRASNARIVEYLALSLVLHAALALWASRVGPWSRERPSDELFLDDAQLTFAIVPSRLQEPELDETEVASSPPETRPAPQDAAPAPTPEERAGEAAVPSLLAELLADAQLAQPSPSSVEPSSPPPPAAGAAEKESEQERHAEATPPPPQAVAEESAEEREEPATAQLGALPPESGTPDGTDAAASAEPAHPVLELPEPKPSPLVTTPEPSVPEPEPAKSESSLELPESRAPAPPVEPEPKSAPVPVPVPVRVPEPAPIVDSPVASVSAAKSEPPATRSEPPAPAPARVETSKADLPPATPAPAPPKVEPTPPPKKQDEGRPVESCMHDPELIAQANLELAEGQRKGLATILLATPEEQLEIASFFGEEIVLVPRTTLDPSATPLYYRFSRATGVELVASAPPLEGRRQYRDLFDYDYGHLPASLRDLRRSVPSREDVYLFAALLSPPEWAIVIARRQEALARAGRDLSEVSRFVLRYARRPGGGFDLRTVEIDFSDGTRVRPGESGQGVR